MSEITAEQVADSLTGDDNDYNDALDGWFGLHSEGATLHISFTDESTRTQRHFRATVEEVPPDAD